MQKDRRDQPPYFAVLDGVQIIPAVPITHDDNRRDPQRVDDRRLLHRPPLRPHMRHERDNDTDPNQHQSNRRIPLLHMARLRPHIHKIVPSSPLRFLLIRQQHVGRLNGIPVSRIVRIGLKGAELSPRFIEVVIVRNPYRPRIRRRLHGVVDADGKKIGAEPGCIPLGSNCPDLSHEQAFPTEQKCIQKVPPVPSPAVFGLQHGIPPVKASTALSGNSDPSPHQVEKCWKSQLGGQPH